MIRRSHTRGSVNQEEIKLGLKRKPQECGYVVVVVVVAVIVLYGGKISHITAIRYGTLHCTALHCTAWHTARHGTARHGTA